MRAAASEARRPSPDRARLAFAGMIVGNIALSFGPWMVRLADVGPVAAGFWRLLFAVPLLALVGWRQGQPLWSTPRALWPLLALAGLFFAADLAAWHAGILRTRLANATLFGNGASFFFALYGFVVLRRVPSRLQIAALLLAGAGMTLLLGRSYHFSPQYLAGDALCLLGGLLYTGYLIAIDRARGRIRPAAALAAATVAGLAPLLLFAISLGEAIVPHAWTPLLLLALGSQVIGQGLMVYAITYLPPIVVGLGLLTQPAVAATIGWIVYDERLGAADAIGALAIATAVVMVRRQPREG